MRDPNAIISTDALASLLGQPNVHVYDCTTYNNPPPAGVDHVQRYVVGTFRLTLRPNHVCTVKGRHVRVAFVMRGHKISEWREVPNIPGAPIGPDAPEDAPPLPLKRIA